MGATNVDLVEVRDATVAGGDGDVFKLNVHVVLGCRVALQSQQGGSAKPVEVGSMCVCARERTREKEIGPWPLIWGEPLSHERRLAFEKSPTVCRAGGDLEGDDVALDQVSEHSNNSDHGWSRMYLRLVQKLYGNSDCRRHDHRSTGKRGDVSLRLA